LFRIADYIDGAAIEGMLDKFRLTQQHFRDAHNGHYNLNPPQDKASGE
jgi:hypothetical protein